MSASVNVRNTSFDWFSRQTCAFQQFTFCVLFCLFLEENDIIVFFFIGECLHKTHIVYKSVQKKCFQWPDWSWAFYIFVQRKTWQIWFQTLIISCLRHMCCISQGHCLFEPKKCTQCSDLYTCFEWCLARNMEIKIKINYTGLSTLSLFWRSCYGKCNFIFIAHTFQFILQTTFFFRTSDLNKESAKRKLRS